MACWGWGGQASATVLVWVYTEREREREAQWKLSLSPRVTRRNYKSVAGRERRFTQTPRGKYTRRASMYTTLTKQRDRLESKSKCSKKFKNSLLVVCPPRGLEGKQRLRRVNIYCVLRAGISTSPAAAPTAAAWNHDLNPFSLSGSALCVGVV